MTLAALLAVAVFTVPVAVAGSGQGQTGFESSESVAVESVQSDVASETAEAETSEAETPVPGMDTQADALNSDRLRLAGRLKAIDSYAAAFTQEIQGARGEILERSTGYLRLKRPMFKWVVDHPYPQVIVSEGEVLKIYDPDLEQLTIRPLDDALTDTPISLLTSQEVVLGQDFSVMMIAGGASSEEESVEEVYLILPRDQDTLFAEIRLHFSSASKTGSGDLTQLTILDQLGQYTRIQFERDDSVPVIQSSEFQLEVPPDTDVIGG